VVGGLEDPRRTEPSFLLSLHGLVRHMAEVERIWFGAVLLRESWSPIWCDPATEDSELVPLDDADWEADLATWQAGDCRAGRKCATRSRPAAGAVHVARSAGHPPLRRVAGRLGFSLVLPGHGAGRLVSVTHR
jgi:hypothetical protein